MILWKVSSQNRSTVRKPSGNGFHSLETFCLPKGWSPPPYPLKKQPYCKSTQKCSKHPPPTRTATYSGLKTYRADRCTGGVRVQRTFPTQGFLCVGVVLGKLHAARWEHVGTVDITFHLCKIFLLRKFLLSADRKPWTRWWCWFPAGQIL